ncbi:MAG: NAD(P)H-hydrate dehydratase [Verrucomicrobia bacterium]|nr:NAD(P)H-hydrate dehydratase [Verrucomicrobiota bacterium]
MVVAYPILTCDAAGKLEAALFGGDEAREWPAMQQAGRAVADAVLDDFKELGGFPRAGRVLVLAGKGHNGGDALLAAKRIVETYPEARIDLILVFGAKALRPLALRAWRDLAQAAPERVDWVRKPASQGYDLVLDGVFGFQFRPPLDARVAGLLTVVNALPIRLRAAVDLPSGGDEAGAFLADFTYATGVVKTPVLSLRNAGRLRYLDLGFWRHGDGAFASSPERVLVSGTLDPLRGLRPPHSDKRTYGHLFVVGGSRNYPGAVLMSVLAALRSGVGLVTAFVPESLVTTFAARAPEAMWVGWPETPGGGLALEGSHLLHERIARASALLVGPGLGREPETLVLAKDLVASVSVPLMLDADALQPDIVTAGHAPRILTPHAGELARIEGKTTADSVIVRKGPVTRIDHGGISYHSFFGGPVLARGGSGDVLAGLIGGLLAQTPADPLGAACRGVMWHGQAADALARSQGPVAVQTTQLLDHLAAVLRKAPA